MSAVPTIVSQAIDALCDAAMMERHFPMLIRAGIRDVGLTVHSHFLTFLATAGQHIGFAAVAECPVVWADEYARLGDVRADSVWFDRHTLDPVAAFEFERFDRGDEPKLREKVQNLAIASLATPGIQMTGLIYWVRSGSAPRSMESVVACYRDGFRRRGQQVPGGKAPLVIVKCVLRQGAGDRLLFGEFLRDERNECIALGGL